MAAVSDSCRSPRPIVRPTAARLIYPDQASGGGAYCSCGLCQEPLTAVTNARGISSVRAEDVMNGFSGCIKRAAVGRTIAVGCARNRLQLSSMLGGYRAWALEILCMVVISVLLDTSHVTP